MIKVIKEAKIHICRIPIIRKKLNEVAIRKWHDGKLKSPPSIIKQQVVKREAEKSSIKTLIETGTYLGDMVYAVKNNFNKIYSIELSSELYTKAKKRFNGNKNVEIINGDSGEMIKNIIDKESGPILFWLDAHYSGGNTAKSNLGDTPIGKELDIIFSNWINGNVVLIDDARLFDGTNNYPVLNDLENKVKKIGRFMEILKNEDIIKIY